MCESVSPHQRMCARACVSMCLHGGEVQDIYLWRHPYPTVGCVFGSVCSSVYVLVRFLAWGYVRVHARHQGVLIYSNELGRITRGWGEGWRWCVCVGGHLLLLEVQLSISLSLSPSHLFFHVCKWDYLHGWGGGRRGRWGEEDDETGKRERQKIKSKNWRWGNGAILRQTERPQTKKKETHTVPGRYHRFQDGCRWRRPLWDQPRDPLLSLCSGWHTNTLSDFGCVPQA